MMAGSKLSAARVPGALNKLTLQLHSGGGAADGSDETFYLYSEHHVQLLSESTALAAHAEPRAPPPSSASQRQKSQSATPSPQKVQRHRPSELLHWTLRLCQRVEKRAASVDDDGSDTEEDEEESARRQRAGRGNTTTAWYMARIDATSSRTLCEEMNMDRWDDLEAHVRTAWEHGCVDVLVPSSAKKEDDDTDTNGDGRYPDICLSFTLQGAKEGRAANHLVKKEEEGDDDDDTARMMLTLTRLDKDCAMQEASFVAIEMMYAFGTLKSRTQSLVEERDSHRKLLKDNRRHERFKEASTSLINPGRIKRKVQDDEGFEDE